MPLPNEVLSDVLAFFDREQLERLEMVGRQFRDLIRSKRFDEFPATQRNIWELSIELHLPDRYQCKMRCDPTEDYHDDDEHEPHPHLTLTGPIERFKLFLRRQAVQCLVRSVSFSTYDSQRLVFL